MSAQWAPKIFLFGALCFSAAASASPREKCREWLERVKTYSKEVADSRGVRLFLKQARSADNRYFRFLSPSPPKSNVFSWLVSEMPVRLSGIHDRKFTPFSGLYYVLVQQPVGELTSRLGRGRLEPTLPVVVLMSALAWQGYDQAWNKITEDKIWSEIVTHKDLYEELLDYDFRFHDIRERMQNGEISLKRAQYESFWRKLAIDKYYSDRDKYGINGNLADQRFYLNFFTNLKKIVEKGVRPAPGFLIPVSAQGPLHDDQILRLIEVNHHLYDQYKIVADLVRTPNPAQIDSHEPEAEQFRQKLTDAFVQQILKWLNDRLISVNEAQSILQEDVFWQARFQEWQIVGATKLKVSNHGTITASPLTLQDIRNEILRSYEEHRKVPAS